MFQRGSVTLFRVRGVPIRAHWTLLLIVPYLAFALSARFGALAERAGVSTGAVVLPPVVWGVVLALALFASVAVHELAHVWVAKRHGARVQGVTLMLLGGVSHVSRMPPRPSAEA